MNTKQDAKTETCSDSSLPLKKRMKPNLNDEETPMLATAETSAPIPKCKGVIKLPNGHWGARIYTHRRRFWLGTFKSAEEAARAYDSASINLRAVDADHQKQSREYQETNKYLFEKELTLSDVGKLNRLVIPKRYALKYLPDISHDQVEREVVFYDRAMRQWKFRYCYWTSSFVFTGGWDSFVKEKRLKEKDVIVFYTRQSCDVDGQSKNFLMIDVHYFSDNMSSVVHEEEVNKTVHETKSERKKGGFMLFGAWIQ